MYLDILVFIIIVMSILDGIKDGFLIQFFNIFGLFIDFYFAKRLTPVVMEKFDLNATGPNYLIMYIVTFFIVYIAIAIALLILKMILKAQSTSLVSRVLGGAFGTAKGFLVAAIVLFVFNFVSQRYGVLEKYGNDSKANTFFLKESENLNNYLPTQVKNELNRMRGKKITEIYLNKLF